jgi:hypothetical protein
MGSAGVLAFAACLIPNIVTQKNQPCVLSPCFVDFGFVDFHPVLLR